ncbi:MAG: PemK family transcriptional regulator [Desulfobacteraceae bacterium IS3]|nr:MAG: PemK family transcriptional regulator [Desulfobacteraceae bacterium IS3]
MNQGDIYWYTFKEPDKRRPVLILTRNSAISFLGSLTVAPITSTIRDIPSEVVLNQNDGVFDDCAVNLDNIQTVQRAKIGAFISHLSSGRMREVRKSIEFALGFDALR